MVAYNAESLKAEAGRLTVSPDKSRALPEEINMLAELVDVSGKIINELENQLSAVLRPSSPEAEGYKDEHDVSSNSILTLQVRELRTRILSQHRQMSNLIERSEA